MGIWRSQHILAICLATCLCMPATKLPAMALENFEHFKEYALVKLGPNTPGLLPLLDRIEKEHSNPQQNQENLSPTNKNKQSYGSTFEIETALQLNQKTQAFNLTIEFRDEFSYVLINGYNIKLTTTEFDVITDKFAIECKTTQSPQNQTINYIVEQIIKEQNMIDWCGELAKELKPSDILNKRPQQENPYLVIKSQSTHGEPIYIRLKNLPLLTNNDSTTPESREQRFINLVQWLANKKLYVFFKHQIPQSLAEKLDSHHIQYGYDINALNAIIKETQESECE